METNPTYNRDLSLSVLMAETEPVRTGMHTSRKMGSDQAVIGEWDANGLVSDGLAEYVRPGWVVAR